MTKPKIIIMKKRGQTKPMKKKLKSKSTPKISNGLQRVNLAKSVAVKKPARAANSNVSLSKCALKFALACSDPFNIAARGACIPSAPSHASQKVHGFARFNAAVGTAGFGFVAVAPSLANDAPCIYYTDATYTGSAPTGVNIFTSLSVLQPGVNILEISNLPYSSDELSSVAGTNQQGAYGKIVSCGLRGQYVGTTLDESGLFYCLQEPTHNNLSGFNVASLGFYADTDVMPVTRTPCTLIMNPVRETELNWANASELLAEVGATAANLSFIYPYCKGCQVFSTSGGDVEYTYGNNVYGNVLLAAPPIGVIGFTGSPGNEIHYEYITHVEYAGSLTASVQSPSEADAEGAGIVMTAVQALPSSKLAFPGKSPWSLLNPLIRAAGKATLKYAVPAIESALTALLL
jgi:hypothetical protein